MHVENIVIGKPIIDLWHLLGSGPEDQTWQSITVNDEERNLPRLLVKYGFTTSTSEIRRNRPDLIRNLDKLDFLDIKLGKKRVWIVIGE